MLDDGDANWAGACGDGLRGGTRPCPRKRVLGGDGEREETSDMDSSSSLSLANALNRAMLEVMKERGRGCGRGVS